MKGFMKISEEKKLDVLLAQLRERYDALHKMRDRSMHFVLWILGLGLGMAWLLINETVLTCVQKCAITVLLLVLGIVTFLFVYAIGRGFKANREVMIRTETALELYEKDCYGISESILPPKFSCQKIGWTGHFNTLYGLIIIVFLTLILLTWTNPYKLKSMGARAPLDPNQIHTQTIIKE